MQKLGEFEIMWSFIETQRISPNQQCENKMFQRQNTKNGTVFAKKNQKSKNKGQKSRETKFK